MLVEVDGNYPEILFQEAEKIMNVVEQFKIDEILFADTEDQKNALWKMRRSVAEAVKANSVYKEEDTVVPRFENGRNGFAGLLSFVKRNQHQYIMTVLGQ